MVFTIGSLLDNTTNSTIIDTIVDSGTYYVLITPTSFGNSTNIKAKENLFGTGFYLIGGGGGGSGAASSGGGAYCSNVPNEEKGSDGKSNGGGGGGGGQLGVVFDDKSPNHKLFVTKNSYIVMTKGLGGNFGTGQGGGGVNICAGNGNNGGTSSISIVDSSINTSIYALGGNGGRLRTNKYNSGGIGGATNYNITGNLIPTASYNKSAPGGKANTEARATPGNGTDIAYYNYLPSILDTYIDNNWTTLNITHAKAGIYPSGIIGDRSSTSPNTGGGGAGAAGRNGGKKSAADAGGGGFYAQGGPTFGKYVSPSGTVTSQYMSGNDAPWKGLTQQTFAGEGGGGGTAGVSGNNHQGGQGGSGSAFFWFTVKPPTTPSNFSFLQSKPNRVLSHDEPNTDPQDYSLTETISVSPTHGTAGFPFSTTAGDYIVEYTPNINSLSTDSFEYTVQNVAGLDSTGTTTATIPAFEPYDQPTSGNASRIAIGDLSLNFNIVAQYDTDIAGDIYDTSLSGASLNITSGPSNGTITVNPAPSINLTSYTATFSVIYHSPSPYIGTDSFTFTVEDASRTTITINSGVSPTYTISLTVKDPAITYDISAYAVEDMTSIIDLSGSDLDDYYPLKYFLDSYVSNGTLSDINDLVLNITDASYIGVQDTSTNLPPIIKYLGNSDFNGWDQFTFFVQDIHNYVSNIGSTPAGIVDISVAAVNDAPVAYDLIEYYYANNTANDFSYNIDLSANDVDNPQTDLTYYIESLPTVGTLSYNGTPVNSVPFVLTPIASYDISYTPTSTFVGLTSFEYYVEDLEPLSSNTANVTIYLEPRTQDMSYVTIESTSVDIIFSVTNSSLYANDYQSVIKSYPQYGLLYDKNQGLIAQDVIFNGIECNYIPQPYYFGHDSFSYEVEYIGNGLSLTSNESTVDISINFVNNKPVIPDQTFTFYVREESEVFDLSLVYYNYDGPDISDSIVVNTIPNFTKDDVTTTSWPGYIYDNLTNPLTGGDTIENNNTPVFQVFKYFVNVKFAWPGNQYIGTSEFQIQAMESVGGLMSDVATITVNFKYSALNGCDTGPGPNPERVWTRDDGDCTDLSGAFLPDGSAMTREDLSEKRKAVIFQYKNNSAGFSKKQQFSRLARGLGKPRGKTYATQGYNVTNPNVQNLPLVGKNVPTVVDDGTGNFVTQDVFMGTTLVCTGANEISGLTTQNDTPGPTRTITNYPTVPLTNYIVRRTYKGGSEKWPQYGPNTGQPRLPKYARNTGTKPGMNFWRPGSS